MQIPQDWALPPDLKWLELSENALFGSLPPGLRLPDTVNTIWLYANKLSGTLPNSFHVPASIGIFYLSDNNFTGEVGTSGGCYGLCGPAQLGFAIAFCPAPSDVG